MKRIAIRTAAFLLLLVWSSFCWADLPPEILNRAKQATVLVETREGYGTAFCIDTEGLFITNDHVAEGADANGHLHLVLHPGEAGQKRIQATVIRIDPDVDLAVLLVDDIKGLKALSLGESADLIETSAVVAFGYPFGKDLATTENAYPSITVSLGHITALRKTKGQLEHIQLDASLNPGNSGGPVLNSDGKVIGIVQAGIPGSGINFAIPVDRLRTVLHRTDIFFDEDPIPPDRLGEEHDFTIHLLSFDGLPKGVQVEMILSAGDTDHRIFLAKAVGEDTFHVKAVPVPTHGTQLLRVTVHGEDGTQTFRVKDRTANIGGVTFPLSKIKHIQHDSVTRVTLTDGRELHGTLSGLETTEATFGGATITLNLNVAKDVTIQPADPSPTAVTYHITVRQNGKTLAESSGDLTSKREVAAAPVRPAVATPANPVAGVESGAKITAGAAHKTPTVPHFQPPAGQPFNKNLTTQYVELETRDMVYDPVSKKIYASIPGSVPGRGNTITVVDPATGAIGPSIFVGSEPGRMAISDNGKYIYVVLEGADTIRRFDVPNLKPDILFSRGNISVEDMKVPPGHPDWVVIAKCHPGYSPRHAGDSLFINGIEIPGGPQWGPNVLAFAESGEQLWGLYNELGGSGFGSRMFGPSGWSSVDNQPSFANSHDNADDIKYELGYFYTSNGHIYDLNTLTMLGTFSGGGGLMWPETRKGRVLFLQGDGKKGHRLRACDINTLTLLGDVDIPDVNLHTASRVASNSEELATCPGSEGLLLRRQDKPENSVDTFLLFQGEFG